MTPEWLEKVNKVTKPGVFTNTPYGKVFVHPKKGRRYIKKTDGTIESFPRFLLSLNGIKLPKGSDIHHLNENKMDDRVENYDYSEHHEHARNHLNFVKKKGSKIMQLTQKIAAAPSVSELYKKFVSDNNIYTPEQFNTLLYSDPTYVMESNKVGSYTLWLLRVFKTIPDEIDIDYINNWLNIIEKIKGRLPSDLRKLDAFGNFNEYISYVEDYNASARLYDDSGNEILSDNQWRKELAKHKNEITNMFEDDQWLVIHPESHEASCYWGSGTDWCTAKRKDRAFQNYESDGNLYIIIDKTSDPGSPEKYQLHVSSGGDKYTSNTYEFRDLQDDTVDITEFMQNRASEGLKQFFTSQNVYDAEGLLDSFYDYIASTWADTYEEELPYYLGEYLDETGKLPSYISYHVDSYVEENINSWQEFSYNQNDWYPIIRWKDIKQYIDDNKEAWMAEIQKTDYNNTLNAEQAEGQQFIFDDATTYAKTLDDLLLLKQAKLHSDIYSAATNIEEFIKIATNISATDVPEQELQSGIKVEHEHTSDEAIAKQIALDHEAEAIDMGVGPVYYEDYLLPMEEQMKKDGK